MAAVFTALALTGALAPATAHAATTSIRWETWSTTLQPDDEARACAPGTFDTLQQGGTVTVEVLLSGSWVTKQTVPVAEEWMRCVSVVPSRLVAGPGRYAFRAQYRATTGAAPLLASTTLTLAKAQSNAYVADVPNYSYTTTPGRSVVASVSPPRGQYVDLQRRSGDTWVRVARARAGVGGGYETDVRLAVPTRAGLSHYRVLVNGTTWSHQAVSPSYPIHQTDAVKHQQYIASARYYMNRFCPKTPIYVDTPAVTKASGPIGLATTGWSEPSPGDPGEISARIELRSGFSGGQLRDLALHECAHVVQNRAHVVGKAEVEEQRAWKLWPRVGHEGQADCMVYDRMRTTRWLYYVDGCNASQQYNAARMWRDYGTRFQAEPYTWGA